MTKLESTLLAVVVSILEKESMTSLSIRALAEKEVKGPATQETVVPVVMLAIG